MTPKQWALLPIRAVAICMFLFGASLMVLVDDRKTEQ